MIAPPIFVLCFADTGVKTLLGTAPLRVFPFGAAPQGVAKPYAVWQLVTGSPENYLAGRPDAEGHTLQIDVYGDTAASARAALSAIEAAIELDALVARYGGESRDPETQNYRASMDVDWIVYR